MTEEEAKAEAAEKEIEDGPNDEGEMFTRPGAFCAPSFFFFFCAVLPHQTRYSSNVLVLPIILYIFTLLLLEFNVSS